MIVTLHLGPMSGDVLVSIAGKETRVHVNANTPQSSRPKSRRILAWCRSRFNRQGVSSSDVDPSAT
jgi:hypothetical protein